MIYKNWKAKFVSCLSPYLIILSVSLMSFSASAISTIYTAQPQQAIAQTTTAATPKPTSSNAFLTYENNSTLGINIQYPSNWEKDSYDNKVAFFAPSLDNPKIIPVSLFVDVDNLPFQITDVDDYISHYINHLRTHAGISEPIGVSSTSLAGNLAHNFTAFAKIGQDFYHATDIIMLSGIKKYEITYYIAEAAKSSSYLPTIQKMIDSFEIQDIVNHMFEHVEPTVSQCSDNLQAIINLDCLSMMFQR